MESKKEIYDMIPEGCAPRTLLHKPDGSLQALQQQLSLQQFGFPLIVKPDIGMRGLAVKKVNSMEELERVLAVYEIDCLVQEFIAYEKEAGVFYCRMPGETNGYISCIVAKEFLAIAGDGKKTVRQLVKSDKRFSLQLPSLEQEYGAELEAILPAGEKRVLVPYGNHARGALFLDRSNLADAKLTAMIDRVCNKVPGFHYGRLDIRYDNWNDFTEGRKFSIIELNGAGSEPTHIYDPRHSLFFAWKEIIRHWFILYRISRANHRLGHRYMRLKEGAAMFRANKYYVKKLEQLHQRLLSV